MVVGLFAIGCHWMVYFGIRAVRWRVAVYIIIFVAFSPNGFRPYCSIVCYFACAIHLCKYFPTEYSRLRCHGHNTPIANFSLNVSHRSGRVVCPWGDQNKNRKLTEICIKNSFLLLFRNAFAGYAVSKDVFKKDSTSLNITPTINGISIIATSYICERS